MDICFEGGEIGGTVSAPPSKSHTHRAFILAALAPGSSLIRQPLLAADTESTLQAMIAMGASAERLDNNILIHGGWLRAPDEVVDVGNSGSSLRLLSAVAATLSDEVSITGDQSLQTRPMGPLLSALEELGACCDSRDGFAPVTLRGPLQGGVARVDGSISSQFISALLMAAPLAEGDVTLIPTGELVSEPYIDITLQIMSQFGAKVVPSDDGFRVEGGQSYQVSDYRIPGDFSSAAFLLAAGALGGELTVENLDPDDPQGDRAILEILKRMGAEIQWNRKSVKVRKSPLRGLRLDMGDTPDLFPMVAVLAAVADGESVLYGAPHLRHKESDRIQSTVAMLRALGASVEEHDDGCTIQGGTLKGGEVDSEGDHRLAMAAAIASLASERPVLVRNAECHVISFPSFLSDIQSIGMSWREA